MQQKVIRCDFRVLEFPTWRPLQDSNLRPPAPETGALSAELRGLIVAPSNLIYNDSVGATAK